MSVDWKSQVKRLMARGADYADVRYYPKSIHLPSQSKCEDVSYCTTRYNTERHRHLDRARPSRQKKQARILRLRIGRDVL
jgi:hypothetical protein